MKNPSLKTLKVLEGEAAFAPFKPTGSECTRRRWMRVLWECEF